MSFNVVFQKKFKPDFTGGSRIVAHFRDNADFLAKRNTFDNCDVVATDVGESEANILLSQVPDICLILDVLRPMFDQDGQLIKDNTLINSHITKAAYGIIALRELQGNQTMPHMDHLPDHLRILAPFWSKEDTNWIRLVKLLKYNYPAGTIGSPDELNLFLNNAIDSMI